VGYFPQGQEGLRLDATPLELALWSAELDETDARTYLHRFLFAGEDVNKPASDMSYGERARLILALLVLGGANLLVLDEPLSHLDLPSREAFERALLEYDGTTLTVLHDRYAIDRLATRVVELA
jgi:ATP-binding cassette subfamily F protein 3